MKDRFKLLATLLTFCLACSEPTTPGSLDFQWRLGSQSCEAYGVERVHAALFGFSQIEPMFAADYACESGEGQMSDVAPGEYTFVLEGRDVNGCGTHEVRIDDVIVGTGQTIVFERSFGLVRKRRPIELTWNFANQLDCVGNQIEQVEILLQVDDVENHTEIRACEGFKTQLQADIAPSDVLVTVYGIDGNGQRVVEGQIEVTPGVTLGAT